MPGGRSFTAISANQPCPLRPLDPLLPAGQGEVKTDSFVFQTFHDGKPVGVVDPPPPQGRVRSFKTRCGSRGR